MSERYVVSDLVPISILDMEVGDTYPIGDEGIFDDVVDLLNGQDECIKRLWDENIKLSIDNKELKCANNELHTLNKKLKQRLEGLTMWCEDCQDDYERKLREMKK